MLKTTLLILTLWTISLTVFSQDMELKCGDNEIECLNGNKSHFEMVLHCPYEETDTLFLPEAIMDSAKKYLIDRMGTEFYHKLIYYSCQTVDFKKYRRIKKRNGWISKDGDRRVKFAIQYYFTVQDGMRYYLSIVFDKSGNIISKDQLPNLKRNKFADRLMNVCDAKLIAEKDTVFSGELQNISLEYSDSVNTFIWRIEKPSIVGTKPREDIHRFLLINAVDGQIINRETESWISVCSGNRF